jgi:oligopeptide/dipeptide ABC transporter ATP-binding protein
MALLEVEGLSVRYPRTTRPAVCEADLELERGRTIGLVGESGSGKSSLGAALLGMAPISAGRVRFDGEDITSASPKARRRLSRRMQVVFQDPYGSLNPARTVGDAIGEGLRYAWRLTPDEVRRRVATVLDEVGLPASAAQRYPASFSGGQRQRIAIARAIVGDPDFVVCDEPVSALDLSVQAQVLNLLARLQADRGLAYLFVSHDLSVVRYLSDEIVVMYAGRVVERGPAATIAAAPAHPYTRALIAAAPVPDPAQQARNRAARRAVIGTAEADRAAVVTACPFTRRCPHATDVCATQRPPLLGRGDGHVVACHHADTLLVAKESR